jgi:sulfur transfer protein SufE
MFPIEASAVEAERAIAEEFSFFGDWSERYQYLIDLGRKLPDLPEELKTEENRLKGCQSKVWIVAEGDASKLDFRAISDSSIVSGLVYLALAGLLRAQRGRDPRHAGRLHRRHRPRETPLAHAQQRPDRPARLHQRQRAFGQLVCPGG